MLFLQVQEEKRQEKRRRGDEATQTSDARFDERFALAHRLTGRAAQPWYARRGSTLPSEGATAGSSGLAALPPFSKGLLLTQGPPCAPAGAPRLERPSDAAGERPKHKRKRRKDFEASEAPRKARDELPRGREAVGVPQQKAARLAALREERQQREAAEAARARALLFASQEQAGAVRGGKRYHGAFRAPLPRRPQAAGLPP